MDKKQPTSFDLRDEFLRSFTGKDETAHTCLKAAVDKDLRRMLAPIPKEDIDARKNTLQSKWDTVEHIYSWIKSSMCAHDLFQNDPDHREAEYVSWLEDKDKKDRPKLLVHNGMDALYKKADIWSKQRQAKINLKDLTNTVETVKTFPNGYRIVRLNSPDDLRREGKMMGHCVGDGAYNNDVKNGDLVVYSLRDQNNEPHATIGVRGNVIEQSKGKSNLHPVTKYMPYLQEFFNERQFELYESIANTGMIQVGDTIYPFENIPAGTHFDELDLRDCYWIKEFPDQVTADTVMIGKYSLDGEYDPSFYASLPTDLSSLEVRRCASFDGHNLPTNLSSLKVYECDSFDGHNLPTNLSSLEVWFCASFDGHNLPTDLSSLDVDDCASFDGRNLPANLSSLEVERCASFDPSNLDQNFWDIEQNKRGTYTITRKKPPVANTRPVHTTSLTP